MDDRIKEEGMLKKLMSADESATSEAQLKVASCLVIESMRKQG